MSDAHMSDAHIQHSGQLQGLCCSHGSGRLPQRQAVQVEATDARLYR